MSGTSVDGIDAALVDFSGGHPTLRATSALPFSGELRARIFALSRGENESIHELCSLDRTLGECFAEAALGVCAAGAVDPGAVRAIGSHGQTIRHAPETAPAYSLQLGDPNTIAERSGICTVADFRRRDIAAGGQGAPLVPPCHAALFGQEGKRRAIVNIGGIANVTLLEGRRVLAGFDCGPGNTLLDAWIMEQRGETFDSNGAWAAEHAVDDSLLGALLGDPYFQRSGPRSTGPEHFNLEWLRGRLPAGIDAGAVQATLAELTSRAIADSLHDEAGAPDAVFVCGGGARNTDLMRRLHRLLDPRGIRVGTTDELGLAAEWVEAAAFAWLARQTLAAQPGNSPAVTGAAGERVLGAIYAGAASGQ
jgi:anhydro-N-acetylmuramic acid kinase